jgi:hypothetical protein
MKTCKFAIIAAGPIATKPDIEIKEEKHTDMNSPNRADAVVPHSGTVGVNCAVFIKSPTETVVSQSTPGEIDSCATSPSLMDIDDDMGVPREVFCRELKSPQGVRKFHSWLSYFYSGHGKTSGYASPQCDAPASPHSLERAAIAAMLKRQPERGILKGTKPVGDLSSVPQPIQKSVFLRQEEVVRLTKFTERFRNRQPGQSIDSLAHPEEFIKERRKLQFDFSQNSLHEMYTKEEYDRAGVEYVAKKLTPEIANMIKRELNEVKREMFVHEESRHHTQFYVIRNQ